MDKDSYNTWFINLMKTSSLYLPHKPASSPSLALGVGIFKPLWFDLMASWTNKLPWEHGLFSSLIYPAITW